MTLEGEMEGVTEEAMEEVLGVLAGTPWDGALQSAREARAQMYPLLGLQPPKQTQGAAARDAKEARAADENASYAALLADAERGLGSGM